MFFGKTSFVRRGAALIIGALFAVAMSSIFAADPSTSATPADKGVQAAPQSNHDSNAPQPNGGENKIGAATQADAPATAKIAKTATPQPTPSQNVTINLIHRLVQRGGTTVLEIQLPKAPPGTAPAEPSAPIRPKGQ